MCVCVCVCVCFVSVPVCACVFVFAQVCYGCVCIWDRNGVTLCVEVMGTHNIYKMHVPLILNR